MVLKVSIHVFVFNWFYKASDGGAPRNTVSQIQYTNDLLNYSLKFRYHGIPKKKWWARSWISNHSLRRFQQTLVLYRYKGQQWKDLASFAFMYKIVVSTKSEQNFERSTILWSASTTRWRFLSSSGSAYLLAVLSLMIRCALSTASRRPRQSPVRYQVSNATTRWPERAYLLSRHASATLQLESLNAMLHLK